MPYQITHFSGTPLATVEDGTLDQTTDLKLVGKNYAGYGTIQNDNYVYLLENFANSSEPGNPIIGQLWYDTSTGRLKVYDGNLFRVSGGAIVSPDIPAQLATGDLWIDSKNQQMYFNDGVANVLAGPIYTQSQGLSGWQTGTLTDIYNVDHTILYLYLKKTVIGIFSLDAFTPLVPPTGFTTVGIGFTASSISGLTFNVQSKSASVLVAADGTSKTAENFLNTGDSTQKMTTTNQLIIANAIPLLLGPAQNSQVDVDSSKFNLTAKTKYQNFGIYVNPDGTVTGAIFVNSTAQQVGIFTTTPSATLDVNGNAQIRGNLTLTGTSLIINTSVIPASASAAGLPGQIVWGPSYLYVCVALNTWKRTAIATW